MGAMAVSIDPTPADVAALYARMATTLQRVRRTLGRPLTLADKVLLGHLADPFTGDLVAGQSTLALQPDRVLLQDVLGQTAMLQFAQTGRQRVAVPTTIHCDHLIQARQGAGADLSDAESENDEVYAFLRSAAARYGVGFWTPGAGIIHQVALERYAVPGALIVGTDSHTPMAGGLGALGVGVGGADAVEVMAGLPWDVLYPRPIGVYLTGELNGWTAPKDVILRLAGELTTAGATNATLEYFGPGAATISATGKATIANMGAELGATGSVFAYDEAMRTYLEATGRGGLSHVAEQYGALLRADPEVEAEPERCFARVVHIDLSGLEPYVAGPHAPDRVRPISQLATELQARPDELVDAISTALIGSCTNSSYADMSRAADVAEQARAHGLRCAVPLLVTPGSEQVRASLARDGQLASLAAIGGTLLANACGPCIGQWRRAPDEAARPNTIVSSYNRNFAGRNDGQMQTQHLIGSPEIVTALALAGRLSFNPLTDTLVGVDGVPFRLQPPAPAPVAPADGLATGGERHFIAPPADGRHVALAIDPSSERLQVLEPWPAWDGHDFTDLPILVKAVGTTTTDHIAPAGPWLRYRGHLERFSNGLCLGVTNAFTAVPGSGYNVLTGQPGQHVSQIARAYRAAGLRWVIVGDWNYGEGSSREHAALAPRLLGCAAVIARSLARIHESNLKKQGLLALTFDDPADYERLQPDDRLSLLDLAGLAAGQRVACLVRHADGRTEQLRLRHSYTTAQLAWFRAGSALNALRTPRAPAA